MVDSRAGQRKYNVTLVVPESKVVLNTQKKQQKPHGRLISKKIIETISGNRGVSLRELAVAKAGTTRVPRILNSD